MTYQESLDKAKEFIDLIGFTRKNEPVTFSPEQSQQLYNLLVSMYSDITDKHFRIKELERKLELIDYHPNDRVFFERIRKLENKLEKESGSKHHNISAEDWDKDVMYYMSRGFSLEDARLLSVTRSRA